MPSEPVKITRSVEDYLEAMYYLQEEKGAIRVKDIADSLRVKPPSVVEAVKKLAQMDLVSYQKYGTIKLKENGVKIAEKVSCRHELLKDFLILIGVEGGIAERDACSMEHVLDNSTLNRLKKLVEYSEIHQEARFFMEKFREYADMDEITYDEASPGEES